MSYKSRENICYIIKRLYANWNSCHNAVTRWWCIHWPRGSRGVAGGCSMRLQLGCLQPRGGTGVPAAASLFSRGFQGPECVPRGQGLAAAAQSPEAGHWGSTLGLGAMAHRPHGAGLWDSEWSHGTGRGGEAGRSWVSCDFAWQVTSISIKQLEFRKLK